MEFHVNRSRLRGAAFHLIHQPASQAASTKLRGNVKGYDITTPHSRRTFQMNNGEAGNRSHIRICIRNGDMFHHQRQCVSGFGEALHRPAIEAKLRCKADFIQTEDLVQIRMTILSKRECLCGLTGVVQHSTIMPDNARGNVKPKGYRLSA